MLDCCLDFDSCRRDDVNITLECPGLEVNAWSSASSLVDVRHGEEGGRDGEKVLAVVGPGKLVL